jgi:hypothetical protein
LILEESSSQHVDNFLSSCSRLVFPQSRLGYLSRLILTGHQSHHEGPLFMTASKRTYRPNVLPQLPSPWG